MAGLIVQVEQGKLQGKTNIDYKGKNYCSFQGIPYARPPVGDLRFKAPVPPVGWEGVRDATKEASESLSKHMIFFHNIGSEDCLYLNVYTPQLPVSTTCHLPVMVWIHGGAFTAGSGNEEMYGPQYLMSENVILVTINYRLGLLGFLSLEDSSLGVPGNAGLKDMVQALKWIQQNITKFNGDANNVTIFGESAGGAATHYLVLSPMAKGLFHRAIIQSGCALNPWAISKNDAGDVAKIMGYTGPEKEKNILEFLRSVPEDKFREAQDKISDPIEAARIRPYGPVIENPSDEPAFISEHPMEMILSGRFNKVPIMIGYTDREGMLLEIIHKKEYGEVKFPTDFQSRILHSLNVPKDTDLSKMIAKMIKELYYSCAMPSLDNIDNFYLMETDLLFWRGIYVTIKSHLTVSAAPIYVYRMTVDAELNLYKKIGQLTGAGTCHADDIAYIFKTSMSPSFEPDSLEGKSVHRFVKFWTNFAKSGDPNPKEKDPLITVKWEPTKTGVMNVLDIGENLKFGPNPDLDRMDMWNVISELCAINSKL